MPHGLSHQFEGSARCVSKQEGGTYKGASLVVHGSDDSNMAWRAEGGWHGRCCIRQRRMRRLHITGIRQHSPMHANQDLKRR